MNVAIGQGSLAATPLRMAVAYSALVNGGNVWRPYVVGEIRDLDGNLVSVNAPTTVRTVPLDPGNVRSLLTDLKRVVTEGTAAAAFLEFRRVTFPGRRQDGNRAVGRHPRQPCLVPRGNIDRRSRPCRRRPHR